MENMFNYNSSCNHVRFGRIVSYFVIGLAIGIGQYKTSDNR